MSLSGGTQSVYDIPPRSAAGGWKLGNRRDGNACVACKKRKTKCSAPAEGQSCEYCISARLTCSFLPTDLESTASMALPTSYVNMLEQRLRATEALLVKLGAATGVDLVSIADKGLAGVEGNKDVQRAIATLRKQQEQGVSTSSTLPSTSAAFSLGLGHGRATEVRPIVPAPPPTFVGERYAGDSSVPAFIRRTEQLSSGAAEFERELDRNVSLVEQLLVKDNYVCTNLPPQPVTALLSLSFFERYNFHTPVLHRPSWDRLVASGAAETDSSFRRLFWIVLGVGAQMLGDPFANTDWSVAQLHLKSSFSVEASMFDISVSSLFDMQASAVLACFMSMSVSTTEMWARTGIMLRKFVDAGGHVENAGKFSQSPLIDQLRKRAFWVLMCSDIFTSCTIGRNATLTAADFDLSCPLAISDAALDAWNANPTAPAPEEDPLAPSITFSFLSRAVMTLSYVLQNICAPKASESAVVLKQHVDHVEAEMAAWEESLPPHLQWNDSIVKIPSENLITTTHLRCAACVVRFAAIRPLIMRAVKERGPALAYITPAFEIGALNVHMFTVVLKNVMEQGKLHDCSWFIAAAMSYPVLVQFCMLRSKLVCGKVLLNAVLGLHLKMRALRMLAPSNMEAKWVLQSAIILASQYVDKWRESDGFSYSSLLLSPDPPDLQWLATWPHFSAMATPMQSYQGYVSSDGTPRSSKSSASPSSGSDIDVNLPDLELGLDADDEKVPSYYPFEPDLWQTALKSDMFALQTEEHRTQLWNTSGFTDVIW